MSKNYSDFKQFLEQMQSKARITTSVAEAVARAQNLPEAVEVDPVSLVSRAAMHRGIELNRREVYQASSLVKRELMSNSH
jgi:hypothetical protein